MKNPVGSFAQTVSYIPVHLLMFAGKYTIIIEYVFFNIQQTIINIYLLSNFNFQALPSCWAEWQQCSLDAEWQVPTTSYSGAPLVTWPQFPATGSSASTGSYSSFKALYGCSLHFLSSPEPYTSSVPASLPFWPSLRYC